MSALRGRLVRITNLVRRKRSDREFEAELESHLAMHVADNLAAGLTAEEARRRALIALGGVEPTKEAYRESRGVRAVEDCLQDFKFAARLLSRNRGFTLTVAIVLAFGIGASNTFFTIVDAICIRGLTLDEPSRVMDVSTLDKEGRERRMSYPDFEELQASAGTFSGIAAFAPRNPIPMSLADDQTAPERFTGAYVSANVFRLVGEIPVAGRDFTSEDEEPGATAVVMLGRSVWERMYHADPGVVGRTLRVNGRPAVVVGVMPDRSKFPNNAEIWQPLQSMTAFAPGKRSERSLAVVARLARGRSLADGRSEVEGIGQRLARQYPDANGGIRFRAVPINAEYVATISDPAWITFIVVGWLVLIVACANVSNLLLMHSVRRSQEMAVRASMGATRGRVVRQLLAESMLLAALGGAMGLALSAIGVRVLWAWLPVDALPYWMSFTINARAVAIITGLSLLTALGFGISPALHVSSIDVGGALKESGRTSSPARKTRRWSTVFLTAQLALGMLFLSFVTLARVSTREAEDRDPAIDQSALVTAQVALPAQKYVTPAERLAFYERLDGRLQRSSAILSAAEATSLPFAGASSRRLILEGQNAGEAIKAPSIWSIAVNAGYFTTLGLPIIQGRGFNDRDGEAGNEAAIVNQRLADRYFPGVNPVGRRIQLPMDNAATPAPWLTVVGVSPTVRQRDAADLDPVVYLPFRMDPPRVAALIVKGRVEPAAIAAILRKEASALDPDLPVFSVMTMAQAVDDARWNGRLSNVLANAISWIAVGLALIGLYAVTAHAVAERTQEIGVRMALGAQPGAVASLMLRRVLAHLAMGLTMGVACVFASDKFLRVGAGVHRITDMSILATAASLLLAFAMLACLVPVIRAVRTNPVTALRYQ